EFRSGSAIQSSPAIGQNGVIYSGSYDANLYALNPDGTTRWQFPTSGLIFSSPAIAPDGTIYIGSYDQKLYAITPNGSKRGVRHGRYPLVFTRYCRRRYH